MKKIILLFLPFLLFLVSALVSCEEVEETTKYDNWKERNEAYIDSIKTASNEKFVATTEQVKTVPVGNMFIIQNWLNSSDQNPQYIYCRKLVANPEGQIPIQTEAVNVYYYGTLITGERFDGGFDGYGALDQIIPNPPGREPSPFSWNANFSISDTGLRTGWKICLQYMAVGERWMVYIPSASAYGDSGSGAIPGYSALVFDIILNNIVE